MGTVKLTETIPLAVPIKSAADGQEITHVTMRRPKVRDQLNHLQGDELTPAATVAMFTDLCEGMTPEDMHELDLSDFESLQEVFYGFLGRLSPRAEAELDSSG